MKDKFLSFILTLLALAMLFGIVLLSEIYPMITVVFTLAVLFFGLWYVIYDVIKFLKGRKMND